MIVAHALSVDLVRNLWEQARASHHRRVLLLAGAADWTASGARLAVAALPELSPVWLTQRPLADSIRPIRDAIQLLGQDLELLIYDAHGGFDPDGFGAATGAIRGGGLLILLTPPLADWPNRSDPEAERIAVWPHSADSLTGRFLARLVRVLMADPTIVAIQQQDLLLSLPDWTASQPAGCATPGLNEAEGRSVTSVTVPSPKDERRRVEDGHGPWPLPILRSVEPARAETPERIRPGVLRPRAEPVTLDQQQAVDAILKTSHGRARRPLVLTAHRGRGKSAALGLAAGHLLHAGECRILVTAPRRASVDPVFRHAEAVLRETEHPEVAAAIGKLSFQSPAELIAAGPDADLLLVDEAAGIPAPLLETLLARYPRVVFATTVHGYEGTGRGFEIRFRATLDRLTPNWRALRLDTPIRWAPADPLETLTFRALLLDAAPAPDDQLTAASPATCRCERLDPEALAQDEPTLRELFGLLVLAHYQTRPMDLRMLLDGANVRIYVLRHGERIAATLLAAEEGGFADPALRESIYLGQRRPRGHLLPQTLSAHAGLLEAPAFRYLRVIRIAVHPALIGRGLGRRLLRALFRDGRADGIDLAGASFGATPELLRFWDRCGYRPVQIGTSRNAASGEQAVVVLRRLNVHGWRFAALARQRLASRLPVLLAGPLRALSPDVAVALLASLPAGTESPTQARESRHELAGFVSGHRTLDATLPLLAHMTRHQLRTSLDAGSITPREAALLVATACQLRPMAELISIFLFPGHSGLLSDLRRIAGQLRNPDKAETANDDNGHALG
ncbi:tRNA(Met) cytidine acetyltransferase TmcA [Thiocystis violascens]|uniref:tRNA(Met) cytidine acetyltransferase TmcA n=1 Tax=Thiocystis violascens (strain ATCC 17096 / DSM 198 / 6111) TaxID=765911 RepID=I3YH06_THIV6|nr:GNAT family N-acetyltransferase [Thiocystis violascens]AFL76274.1 putative P-loop ATPase fused to an acetyltransferase [Thiocystis violascens DSM 198]